MATRRLAGPFLATLLLLSVALATPAQADPQPLRAIAVSAGHRHTCVLQEVTPGQGNVDCYGIPDSRSEDYLLLDAVAVSTGTEWSAQTCILTAQRNVVCHGDGAQPDYSGGDAAGVAIGLAHRCILDVAGDVACAGNDHFGQAQPYLGGDATAVVAGTYHTCVLTSAGDVGCFGDNEHGQAAGRSGGDAVAVSAGAWHTCVLTADGNVDCFGHEASDYLGGDAVAVSAGIYFTCVLTSAGNVDCYGTGIDSTYDYLGGDAVAVSAGDHVCVLTAGGDVDCSGYDNRWGKADDYDHEPLLPILPGLLGPVPSLG